ncbi:MAG: hypothetical protein H0W86_05370, partial [Armatimonadetes bacterium]|nr:hypothetical protein [Armatimonadota bacterium]
MNKPPDILHSHAVVGASKKLTEWCKKMNIGLRGCLYVATVTLAMPACAETGLSSAVRELPDYGQGLSGDGKTVVGSAKRGKRVDAWKWTAREGTRFLPMPKDASSAGASDVSDDGTVIVGTAQMKGKSWVCVWRGRGAAKVICPDSTTSGEVAVSGDGKWVVGGSNGAFKWSEKTGIVKMRPSLAARPYSGATCVSKSGTVLAGYSDVGPKRP